MDCVVTLPISFGLDRWIDEGGLPGEPWDEEEDIEYDFYLGWNRPKIEPGERVYVCYKGKLIGYAPLVRVASYPEVSANGVPWTRYSLVRHNGAVAVTVPNLYIKGFRGFKYRVDSWPEGKPMPENIVVWSYEQEVPFPEWMDLDKTPAARRR